MKKAVSFLFILLFFTIYSQDNHNSIYTPHHFTVSIKDGLHSSIFKPTYGTDKLEERFGHIYQLQFDYIFNLKTNFGLVLRSNFGAGAFTYDLASKDGFLGTEGWSKFYRDSYNGFAKLGLGANFHKQLKPKLFLNIKLGIGTSINSNLHASISSFSYTDTEGTIVNNDFDINYKYSDDLIGYGFMDLGVNYLLKNKNLIGLSLLPELFFKPNLTGT
jgi:hypothetical protein